MGPETLKTLIDQIASSLSVEQLADEPRAVEAVIGFAVAHNIRPSEIAPHLDTILNRSRALKLARAA